MHEFAHALYSQKVDQSLPWELRDSGHILTTEAVAILFQGMTYSPDWIKKNLDLDDNEIDQIKDSIIRYSRLNDLIFSRWAQVMYRFEKSMYENPDQDLNRLWWDLVEKYQLIKKPEGRNSPDWASKIHVVSSPVYYHNYMLGHLYGAQLKEYINTNVLKTGEKHSSYFNNKEIGEYFIKEVFNLGNRYPWNVIIEKSTGEKLNIQHFVNQISE
jgi:peptidyl-dipeptidase A